MTHRVVVPMVLLLAAPAYAFAASHPHLLFGQSDVATLRAQAQSTHANIYAALKTGTDAFLGTQIRATGDVVKSDGSVWYNLGDRRDVGDALIVFSFVWQIDGGSQYLTLAQNWLMDAVSWSTLDLDPTGQDPHDLIQEQILAGVAFAYDVLYPTLSVSQRSAILAVIQENASEVVSVTNSGIWWKYEFLQNHNWINYAALGLAALAVEGDIDSSLTNAWRKLATDNVGRVTNATSGITDGTWHEGLSYLAYGYLWELPYLVALRRAGHEDLTDFPILHQAGRVAAHGLIPELSATSVLTYADFYGFGMDVGSLRFAASNYRDGLAQWVANRVSAATKPTSYAPEAFGTVLQFLFYDPTVPETDPHSEPLDWYGSDLQAVIFRSSWDKGGTLFALKSGTYGGRSVWSRLKAQDPAVGRLNWGHDHADDNGFYLYGNGTWLAPEAEGYGSAQASFTRFHNSITIDNQGQLGEGPRASGDEDLAYSWFGTREGSIPFHGSSAHFGYATGNGAHLYDSSFGLTRWDRHALFLDRKWVVLRDVIEASKSHSYAWFAHFMQGVTQDGSWLHGNAGNGQALGVAVVAPASWNLNTSQQSLPNLDQLNPSGSVYAAAVIPSTAQANANFLTALVPVAESSWATRPIVAALDVAARDVGLLLTDGSKIAAALFNKLPSGEARAGGYHLLGQAGVAEYVSGQPIRALLVEATLIEDQAQALLRQDGTAKMLEADGLGSDLVALSGDNLGTATLYAPKATRATWNGSNVSFSRSGNYITVPASGQQPPPPGNGGGGGGGSAGGGGGGSGGTPPIGTITRTSGCSAVPATGGLATLGLLLAAALRRRRK